MKRLMIMGIAVMMVVFGSLHAQAAVTTNEIQPLDQVVVIPCTGEIVHLTGELHVLTISTLSKRGMLHTESHFQPMNVVGVGETSGDVYHAVGITRSDMTLNTTGGFPVVTTLVNDFYIIGVGSAVNYRVHSTIQMTINANGEVTADVDNTTIECE